MFMHMFMYLAYYIRNIILSSTNTYNLIFYVCCGMFRFLETFKLTINYKSQKKGNFQNHNWRNVSWSTLKLSYLRMTEHTAYLRSLTQPCVCGVQCQNVTDSLNCYCGSLDISQQLSDFLKGNDLYPWSSIVLHDMYNLFKCALIALKTKSLYTMQPHVEYYWQHGHWEGCRFSCSISSNEVHVQNTATESTTKASII